MKLTQQEIRRLEKLSKDCRKLIVDIDLTPGYTSELAKSINAHRSQVSMALAASRKTRRSLEILEQLHAHLTQIKRDRR